MLRRPATTLLYIGPQHIARADFARGARPALLNIWQQQRPDGNDLALLAETALVLGPKVGRHVWVLCSDFWTQTAQLAARATANLSEADLSQALSFEVEPLSGMNAFESVLGQTLLGTEGDGKNFWIVQALLTERDAVEDIVRKAGGRLLGMGHPGGLPWPLAVSGAGAGAGAGETSWQRVELWPDVIVCLHGENGSAADVHLIKADARQQRWHSEEEAWREKHGVADRRELLQLTGEILTFGRDGQPVVQDDPQQTLGVLLTAWAGFLARKPTGVPLIRPQVRPMSSGQRLAIAGCLAAAVFALCWGHRWLGDQQKAAVQQQLTRLRQPGTLLAPLDKQLADGEKQRAELTQQNDKLRRLADMLGAQRGRLAKLLAAVAAVQPDDLVIEKIEADNGEPTLHGICLAPKHVNQLTTRLERQLAPDWRVQPPQLKAMNLLPDGGPYTFQLPLQLAAAPGDPTPQPARTPSRSNSD